MIEIDKEVSDTTKAILDLLVTLNVDAAVGCRACCYAAASIFHAVEGEPTSLDTVDRLAKAAAGAIYRESRRPT